MTSTPLPAMKPDDPRVESGRQLLALTDQVGFGALGAAWVYQPDNDRWQYLLVTPMLDSKGARWVYSRLLTVFRKLTLPPGISPLDIFIASPREAFYRAVSPIKLGGASAPVATVDIVPSAGRPAMRVMLTYRWEPFRRSQSDGSRRFEARVNELLAA